jgi:hypothetical protein
MKKTITTLILVAAMGCSQSGQKNNSTLEKIDTTIECNNSVQFGDIDICLPIIDGMTECYSTPNVKEWTNKNKYGDNLILAFYLNYANYKQVDKLDQIKFDDFFQIYGVDGLRGVKVGQSKFNKMAKDIEGNYIKENWADLVKGFEQNYDDLSIGRPVIIESYSPNSKVRTYVMLIKVQYENSEFVSIVTLNLIQIKERIIFMLYTKNYNGEESIKKAKSKNDYSIALLMDENQ